MIYLDNGATSWPKPECVRKAVSNAMETCTNPGRGGYDAAMEAAEQVYQCREEAAGLFSCSPEQVIMTMNCTHGLNMAIRTLFQPGDRVAITGFEHNAVTRTLRGLEIQPVIAARRLFDWDDTLQSFEKVLDSGVTGAVFTHVSNVFGYILPVQAMAALCREKGKPFIIDAAQSAGTMDLNFEGLGADFVAMPGHKGLQGPQGTGLLLCKRKGTPLLFGGTGTDSLNPSMPEFLPEALEAGTLNVPGIAGLAEGIRLVHREGPEKIGKREHRQVTLAAEGLKELGFPVFSGAHQAGTLSFLPPLDCEEAAQRLWEQGIAVRAGYHCAPLAHESAGTISSGTVRISFGRESTDGQTEALLQAVSKGILRKF